MEKEIDQGTLSVTDRLHPVVRECLSEFRVDLIRKVLEFLFRPRLGLRAEPPENLSDGAGKLLQGRLLAELIKQIRLTCLRYLAER